MSSPRLSIAKYLVHTPPHCCIIYYIRSFFFSKICTASSYNVFITIIIIILIIVVVGTTTTCERHRSSVNKMTRETGPVKFSTAPSPNLVRNAHCSCALAIIILYNITHVHAYYIGSFCREVPYDRLCVRFCECRIILYCNI